MVNAYVFTMKEWYHKGNGACGEIRTPSDFLGFLIYSQARPTVSASHAKMEEGNGVQPSSLAGAIVFKTIRLSVGSTFQTWR